MQRDEKMDLYVYSDESGVFDVEHNRYFVFGGLVFLSKEDKENFNRKYLHAERCLRQKEEYKDLKEIKASVLKPEDRQKLYRSTNRCYRFGVVVDEKKLLKTIFADKKSKQRYLDYAFKIGLKRCLERLIEETKIQADQVEIIHIVVDEHTTATNGIYELREAILQEFKGGTYNYTWDRFFPPLFPKMKDVTVDYVDSSKKPLVRAADIIANKLYFHVTRGITGALQMYVTPLP